MGRTQALMTHIDSFIEVSLPIKFKELKDQHIHIIISLHEKLILFLLYFNLYVPTTFVLVYEVDIITIQ